MAAYSKPRCETQTLKLVTGHRVGFLRQAVAVVVNQGKRILKTAGKRGVLVPRCWRLCEQ